MEKIGTQHGITAATDAEIKLDSAHSVAWRKRESTLKTLVANNNELIDKVGELEGRLNALPFPLREASL